MRRERYSITAGHARRMEIQGGEQDWRAELERDMSDLSVSEGEDVTLAPSDSAPELRAEANELYANARQIEDEHDRLAVLSRALELELAAETSVIRSPASR
jgi:hypothetical protein